MKEGVKGAGQKQLLNLLPPSLIFQPNSHSPCRSWTKVGSFFVKVGCFPTTDIPEISGSLVVQLQWQTGYCKGAQAQNTAHTNSCTLYVAVKLIGFRGFFSAAFNSSEWSWSNIRFLDTNRGFLASCN